MDKYKQFSLFLFLCLSHLWGLAQSFNFADSLALLQNEITDKRFCSLTEAITVAYLNENKSEQALFFLDSQSKHTGNNAARNHQLLELKGKTFYKINNYNEANLIADSLLKLPLDTFQAIDAYRLKAQICFRLDDYLNSIRYFKYAQELILKSGNTDKLDDVMGNIASNYQTIGMLPTALSYSQESYKISSAARDTASMCNALHNMGNINMDLGELDEAKKNFTEGLLLAQHFTDRQVLVLLYSALGTVARRQGNANEALEFQLRGLQEAEAINNNHLIAGLLNNIANASLDEGKTAEAKAYLKRGNELAQESGDLRNLALTNLSLGFLATEEKEYNLSNNYLKVALDYSKKIHHIEYISQVMIGMYDNYKALNQPAQALHYYELYNLYHDSILNQQNKNKINRLKTKFEVEEKEKEFKQKSEAEKAIANEEIKKQKLIRNFSIAMGIALLLLVLFIWLRYRERTRLHKLLIDKNKIIEQSYAELKTTQNELVLTEKQREAQSVRVRIARDIHDELGAGLTKITLLSDVIRKKMVAVDDEIINLLQRIIENSKSVSASLNEIVWAVNPSNDSSESLVAFLKTYADHYLEDAQINYELEFPEEVPSVNINPDLKRNVFLVMKEALNNAVKYSQAKKITVSFSLSESNFVLKISDDGKGFEISTLNARQNGASGNGLLNMKNRMEQVNCNLKIISSPGKGCTIQASGKLL